MVRSRILLLLIPVLMASCVGKPKPPLAPRAPVARPAPPPVAGPKPALGWTDRVLTPGLWTYRGDARGGVAAYGVTEREAALVIRCDRAARRVIISRAGTTGGRMTLRATTSVQTYAANLTDTPSVIAAQIDVNDRQLDAIAFSRGRFLVGLDGTSDLIVPSWPELTRVIEDCRG